MPGWAGGRIDPVTKRLDVLDIAVVYDVPPWLISDEYPRCLRNRVLWQVLRVLHRLRGWVHARR